MTKRTSYQIIRWILSVALFTSFLIFETDTRGKYVYLGITVALFVVYAIHNNGKVNVHLSYFHLVTFPFILYGFASSMWALDSVYTFRRMTTVLETVLSLWVVYMSYDDDLDSESLLNAIRWTGYVVSLYAIETYGLATIRYIVEVGERLDNDFANVNSIGVMASYSLIITYAQIINRKFRWDMIFSVPAAIVSIASGSRKVLIAMVIGFFLVSLIRQLKESNTPAKAFFRVVVVSIVIIATYYIVLQFPVFQSITRRMESSINFFTQEGSTDASSVNRMYYITTGIEQFKKAPLFGIGIDNSRVITDAGTYLHSNVFDLLACGGVFGIVTFYWGFIYLLKHYKGFNKSNYVVVLCIILIVLQFILDFFQVSYWAKDTYVYLLLFSVQAKAIDSERTKNELQASA